MILQRLYRELTVAEILSNSVSLYSARFEYFLFPFLLTNLANGALWQFADRFMPDFRFPQNFTEEFFLWLINYLAVVIPIAVVLIGIGWVISALSNGIAVKYSSDILEGRQASLGRGLSSASASIYSLLTAGATTAVLMSLGFTLFIVPGIIVTIMFSLAVQVIIVEQANTSEGLRRSRNLVAGRWRKTFTVLFFVFLIVAVSYAMGELIGSSFGGYLSGLRWLITSIISSLAQPLYPIALTHLYYSLRVRENLIETAKRLQPTVPVAPPVSYPSFPDLTAFQPRFCYRCGQKLPSDAIYCPQCGGKVKPLAPSKKLLA